jgi:hypothetical protein
VFFETDDIEFGVHVADPDAQRGERLLPWRSFLVTRRRKLVFERDHNGDGGSDQIHVINADGSGERTPDTRSPRSLVTRRSEDQLHEQARKLGRDLRDERRRQRTAATDT